MQQPRRTLFAKPPGIWPAVVFAALMFFLPAPLSAQIQVIENTSKLPLDAETATDLYQKVLNQMEIRGLRVVNKPTVVVHVLEKKEVEQALRRCGEQSCAHILRLGNAGAKGAPLVFLTISALGGDVWMDQPHPALLALAIAVGFDYENRLYLGPGQIREVAEMTASVVRVAREGKISVNSLRAQP